MRVGVIRGDMPGPVCLMDLETVSQYNPPTEPRGQERRIGRPDSTIVGTALDAIGAGLQGTTDVSAGATITNLNHTLLAKVDSAASFTTVTVANAAYASGTALVAAVNSAILTSGLAAVASMSEDGLNLILASTTGGAGSYIEVDSVANGSTFNGAVGFNVAGDSFEVPTADDVIAGTLPVGGPLDVSEATLSGLVGAGATAATLEDLADSIAPHFVETDCVIKSFQVGMMSGYLSASYNPDSSRLPALTPGAAIEVVQDDGVSAFTAPLTVVTNAVHNVPSAGDLTITGTNLGDPEVQATVVRVSSATTNSYVKLYQAIIVAAGGTVGPTSIVIPASLLNGLGVAGSTVRVQYTTLASNLFTAV